MCSQPSHGPERGSGLAALCLTAGRRHLGLARAAADAGRTVTAAADYRNASRWFHLATGPWLWLPRLTDWFAEQLAE